MVQRINENPLTKEEMLKFAEETESIPGEERGFEAHAFTAARVFGKDFNKVSSAMFRMEALGRLLEEGLPGWAHDQEDESALVRANIFTAAGITPVKLDDKKIVFDRHEFLRTVFALGRDV